MSNRQQRRSAAAKAQKQVDPFKLYMNAERFRIADDVLRNTDPRTMSAVGAPSMVMSAFASELYLKCLIALDTERAATGHELRTLFLMLPEGTRKAIELHWNAYCAEPRQTKIFEFIGKTQNTVIPHDLRWHLKHGNEAFVALRYSHEEGHQSLKFFLGDFHNLLRHVILERHPDWGRHHHGPAKELGNIFDPLISPDPE